MDEFMRQYELVYKDLYRLAYYYMGDSHDAEDVVQDTVLAAYGGYKKLREKDSFRAWIFKILVNQCKRKMRKFYQKSEELTENSAVHEPDFTDRTYIHTIFSFLSEEERMIVALIVFGGYKGEEVAGMLHKKHTTIRSKYRRALEKLRNHIE